MTYSEFKASLLESVATLDEISKDEIVAYYAAEFKAKKAEGAQEEDIIQGFGDVDEAADKAMLLLGIEKANANCEEACESGEEEEKEEVKEKKDNFATKFAKDTAKTFTNTVESRTKSEVKRASTKAAQNVVGGAVDFITGIFKKK